MAGTKQGRHGGGGDAVKALIARADQDVGVGGLPSCSMVVLRGDEVLIDVVLGAPHDATYLIWSATKGLVSALMGSLMSDGLCSPDELVRTYLPFFIGEGKQDVTLAHLLLHTAGLAGAPMRVLSGSDPEARQASLAAWRTTTEPGTTYQYHHTAAHWVLAAIIERLTGQTLAEAWETRIAGPLGLRTTTLQPDPSSQTLQGIEAVGKDTPDDVLESLATQGLDVRAMVAEADMDTLLTYRNPEILAAGAPGSGAVSSARDLATLYAALVEGNTDVWSDEVRADLIGNVRNTLPDTGLGICANRSLGFVLAGDDGAGALRELPTSLGPAVFGQPGVGGQIAWADPASGLVFVHLTNGLHRDPLHWWARVADLNRLAAALV